LLNLAITDWDDAYANIPNIPNSERWPDAWIADAARFRESVPGQAELNLRYGVRDRNCLDLFRPKGKTKGLVVFVHGGYWKSNDRTFWSHLAAGPLAHGYAVAIPSYSLCPAVRIAEISREIATAIAVAASRVEGPLFLTGHSAGGQIVSRLAATDTPLTAPIRARISHVLSISGVHDLRPLLRTAMNQTLKLDAEEARTQSPALLEPLPQLRLTCWVGQAERAEFVRQNALLASIWRGLGASTAAFEEPDRHHFDVLDSLTRADGALTTTLLMPNPIDALKGTAR